VNKTFSILALCLVTAGCTPDAYRHSADRDVSQILRQQKKATLGYQPQTEAAVTPSAAPREVIYTRIPETRMAPPATSPIEPSRIELKYEVPGPHQTFPTGVGVPASADVAGTDEGLRSSQSQFQFGPPTPGKTTPRLDLFGALSYATANSRDYRSHMEDLYLAALDVTLQRHLLSPRPFASQSVAYTGGQRDVRYASALTATTAAGVRQQLPYGGEIVAQTLVTFVDALTKSADSGESASVVLSGSIPLLRGAGMVNLEGLIQSERSVVYAVRSFEEYRRSFALDVISGYFNVMTQSQQVNNRRTNVTNLKLLVERTQALYAAGLLSFLEVQQAGQAYLGAENQLVISEQNYRNTIDNFKILIGMSIKSDLEVVPIELEVAAPDISDNMLEVAIRFRLDLQNARDQIDDARRQINIAKNGLLPDLNLSGQGSVGSGIDEPARKIDQRTSAYSLGVTLDLPLDRLAERNEYRRNLIDFERARRNYDALLDTVAANIRESVRAIHSSQAQLEIQFRAIELARRQLEFANELLRQGKASARDLVDAQSALLGAQDDYNAAKADLQVALLQFMRQTGTLRVDPEAGAIGRAMDRQKATIAHPSAE
jgi:outer membrane protein TolC